MAKKPFEQLAAEAPKEGEGVDIGPDSNMAALMGMADEILAKPLPGEDAPAGPPDDEPAAEEPAAADEPCSPGHGWWYRLEPHRSYDQGEQP